MENAVKNDFTQGRMWQVILKMAVPMMLAQLVNVLYNIVDRMYIGHMAGVGSLALTGLGLAMPIITIVSAFAALFGQGGGPLCSIARGEGNLARAEKIMANALTSLIAVGIVLAAAVLIFMEPLLYLFGASDVTVGYGVEYTRIYMLGTVFVMISLGMNSFINAQGFAKIGMLTVVIGAVINIVLDPIFIFALHMGIAGAAIATVIAQACSAAWVMKFLLSDRAILELRLKDMIPDLRIIGRTMALGVTGFVAYATNGFVQIACNMQLQAYGGDLYVGAMTVIYSVRELVHMVVQGVVSGAQPVLGYNYGARAFRRVKQGIVFLSLFCVLYSTFAWIVIMLIPGTLIRMFNNEPALVETAIPCMRIFFCGLILMSLQAAGQHTFVGLGKSKRAVFFSLLRKVFIVIPLVFLLPGLPGFGVKGVFWSEPISDLIGGLACYLTMYFTLYRKLGDDEPRSKTEEHDP